MNTSQFRNSLLGMQENMLSLALVLTANRDDAKDLLQDTTLKILNNKEKFSDNINFKGWVLAVMRNIFRSNYCKVAKDRTMIDSNADIYNLDIANDCAFGSPDGSSHLLEIKRAIGQLDRDVKIPLSMYINGYKYNEIARKMKLPLGTVKSRIFFARQELQKKLKDYR